MVKKTTKEKVKRVKKGQKAIIRLEKKYAKERKGLKDLGLDTKKQADAENLAIRKGYHKSGPEFGDLPVKFVKRKKATKKKK